VIGDRLWGSLDAKQSLHHCGFERQILPQTALSILSYTLKPAKQISSRLAVFVLVTVVCIVVIHFILFNVKIVLVVHKNTKINSMVTEDKRPTLNSIEN